MEFSDFKKEMESIPQLKMDMKALQDLNLGADNTAIKAVQDKLEALEKVDFTGITAKVEGYDLKMQTMSDDLEKAQNKVLEMSEKMVEKNGLGGMSAAIKAKITGEDYQKWMQEGGTKNGAFKIEMAAADMGVGTNVDDYSAVPFLGVPVRNEFAGLVTAQPTLLETITSRPLNGTNTIIESYEANEDGTPVYVAEGTSKPKIDYDIKQKTFMTEEVSAHVVLSDKMLRVVSYVMTQTNIVLMRRLRTVMDIALIGGDGISPNIAGITTLGVVFDGTVTGLKGKIGTLVEADRYKLMVGIMTAQKKQSFAPSFWLLNPTDVAMLEVESDTQKRPFMTDFMNTNIRAFKGIPILENNNVVVGEYALIDSTYLINYILTDLKIEIGHYNDLWIKNKTAVKAFVEHVLVLNPNYAYSIVHGTFANAVIELNA